MHGVKNRISALLVMTSYGSQYTQQAVISAQAAGPGL